MGPRADFWGRVQSLAETLEQHSYYALLGVAADASGERIRDAYYRAVKQLHPDRHARERDPDRKQALVKLYARIGEAHRTLSNPTLRAAYDDGLAKGATRLAPGAKGASRRLVDARDPKTPQARQLLERAQQLLAGGNAKGARAQLQLATQLEPQSAALQRAVAELDAPARPPVEAMRAHARHSVSRPVKVKCASWAQFEQFYTRDVSKGGMFLKARRPLPIDSELSLVMTVPDGREVTIKGRVVRVVEPGDTSGRAPGMGVKFDDLDADTAALLAGMLPRDEPAPKAPPTDAVIAGHAALGAADYAEACAQFERALEQNPDSKPLRSAYHLASGFRARERGDEEEAFRHFDTALFFDPKSEAAFRALKGA